MGEMAEEMRDYHQVYPTVCTGVNRVLLPHSSSCSHGVGHSDAVR